MSKTHSCTALVISAPASGQGKTTVTAALAYQYRQQGKQVRVFKIGPDFLDPMILQQASQHTVYQLDLWMVGEQACRQLLADAAATADIILIEGVMGLFDGDPSTADLAARFNIPVLAVIDGSAMAQTFGALAFGLANYRTDIQLAGVLANRVGSDRHYQMLVDSLVDDLPCYGVLARQKEAVLPSRYLGLVAADEIDDLDQILHTISQQLKLNDNINLPLNTFDAAPTKQDNTLQGVRIAIARDAAFSFIYPANLDLLEAMGAELVFFSPLKDDLLPECDSLYLPGGYPELHLDALANNTALKQDIIAHYQADKPVLAECGGMLYLTESLTDKQGAKAIMVGLINGHAVLQARLTALALQSVEFNGQELRGHTYHHSLLETSAPVIAHGSNPNGKHCNEAVYQQQRLTASYIHFYFASNPTAVAELFLP